MQAGWPASVCGAAECDRPSVWKLRGPRRNRLARRAHAASNAPSDVTSHPLYRVASPYKTRARGSAAETFQAAKKPLRGRGGVDLAPRARGGFTVSRIRAVTELDQTTATLSECPDPALPVTLRSARDRRVRQRRSLQRRICVRPPTCMRSGRRVWVTAAASTTAGFPVPTLTAESECRVSLPMPRPKARNPTPFLPRSRGEATHTRRPA
eukprot:365396-Chlamydomonas_euryale.AAC.3